MRIVQPCGQRVFACQELSEKSAKDKEEDEEDEEGFPPTDSLHRYPSLRTHATDL